MTKIYGPRFWGCNPEIPEYGILCENRPNSGHSSVSLRWVLEPKKLNLDALGPIVSGDEALFPENFFMSEIMVIK